MYWQQKDSSFDLKKDEDTSGLYLEGSPPLKRRLRFSCELSGRDFDLSKYMAAIASLFSVASHGTVILNYIS